MSEQPEQDDQDEHTVAIEVALDGGPDTPELAERLDRLKEVVADAGGVPLRSTDPRRYGARFRVSGDPAEAVEAGVQSFERAAGEAGVPSSPVVDVEAADLDEVAGDRAGGEVPDLVGLTEVADLLGVTPHLATVITRLAWFPAPAAELNAGPVWTQAAIDRFVQLTSSDPGAAEKLAEAAERAGPPASRAVSRDEEGRQGAAADGRGADGTDGT